MSFPSVGAWLYPKLKRDSISLAGTETVLLEETIWKVSTPVTVSVPKFAPGPPGAAWITSTPSEGLVTTKLPRPRLRT